MVAVCEYNDSINWISFVLDARVSLPQTVSNIRSLSTWWNAAARSLNKT